MKITKLLTILIASSGFAFSSCEKEDKLDSKSVFVDSEIPKNALDNYIYNQFVKPYNINILYKYVDKESDMAYHLVPAPYEASIRLTKLLLHLGIEPYNDVTGGKDFILKNYPKLFTFTGSVQVKNNGSVVLGTAEAGTKVALFNLLNLNATNSTNVTWLNTYFFKTVHHEFEHILNQNKPYPSNFASITGTSYVEDEWTTKYTTNGAAVAAGFISPYAAKAHTEDFAELYSIYITRSQADFEAILNSTGATDAGRAIVRTKLSIVKNYMKSEWGIDMDILRANILNRYANLSSFDQTTLN